MMVFRFRALSDEVDDFVRDYEVMYDMDLAGLHDLICDDLEWDEDNFCSFFTADDKWNKLQEFTLVDMQDDDDGVVALPMQDTLLGQIIKERNARLIFMFDIFAARSLYLELTATFEAEAGVDYPRVINSEGDAPHQLDAESLVTDDSPFADAMGDFMEFEGSEDDSFGDD